MGGLVRAVGTDLGIAFDRTAERVRLVDGSGEALHPELVLLTVVRLLALAGRSGVVAVPVTASRHVEEVAAGSRLTIRRTAHSIAALTAAAAEDDVVFAGAPTGGLVFPEVVPGYDSVATLCKLLELLAVTGATLADVVAALPAPMLVTQSVPCPFALKAAVMRSLGEALADRQVDLLDGVKATDDRGLGADPPRPRRARAAALRRGIGRGDVQRAGRRDRRARTERDRRLRGGRGVDAANHRASLDLRLTPWPGFA